MDTPASEVYFSNIRLEDGTDYFLYIGELKNYGVTGFLAESLSRVFRRRFECVAVVPDIVEHYPWSNVVAREGNNVALRRPWSGEEARYPDAESGLYENDRFAFKKNISDI